MSIQANKSAWKRRKLRVRKKVNGTNERPRMSVFKSNKHIYAQVIDDLTGDQRFFVGWAQIWRRKYREAELQRRLLTDSHSPSHYRVIGILSNMPEFYKAWSIAPGTSMHRSDEQRVKIW